MGRASGRDRVKNLDAILARQPPIRSRHVAHKGTIRVVSNQRIENISASNAIPTAVDTRFVASLARVVRLFPHRNGILATFPFGIDIRPDDRATEGFPVFP
jgi:hypothetical protein